MKNTILSCLRHSVFTGRFLLCVVLMAAAVFLASMENFLNAFRSEDLLGFGFHGRFILNAAASDTIVLCLPILCVLPYAASYVDDVKTGFIRLYLHRTSQRAYILGKALGCILSGGLVPVIGLFLAYTAAALVFLPMEAVPVAGTVDTSVQEILTVAQRFFLSGGFWALFGMSMSARMESKYIAYASPFVFYYILIILHERYFDWMYVLYPKAWLFPDEVWGLGQWSIIPLLLELMTVTALLFTRLAKRRLSEI